MLEAITISRVATYPPEPQQLGGLKPINVFFGTNGTGKTTISRIIADPSTFGTCGLSWRSGRALEAHVYNRDFVDRTYSPRLQGIFTLGEAAADVLTQIETARAKVEELNGQIANLSGTLGAADNSSGKRKELADARAAFQEECWSIAPTIGSISVMHSQGLSIARQSSATAFWPRTRPIRPPSTASTISKRGRRRSSRKASRGLMTLHCRMGRNS
jgi:hypothetical protein